MSLLLQALQKAARNREDAGPGHDPRADPHASDLDFDSANGSSADAFHRTEPPMAAADTGALEEITLAEEDEDFFDADVPSESAAVGEAQRDPTPASGTDRFSPRPFTSASSTHAASFLRASDARSTGALDWVRDRPVHTLAAAAGIFLVFYAIYVYLQIAHPGILRGDFLTQPLQAKSPPPRSAPISSAPPPPPAASLQSAATDTAAPTLAAMPADPQKPAVEEFPAAAPLPAADASPRKPAREARTRPERSETERPMRGSRTPPASAQPPQGESTSSVTAQPPTLEDNVAVRTPQREPQAMPSVMQAWDALQQGRYEDAEGMYKAAAELDADNVDVMLGLAAIAVHRGHPDQAARYYANALEREPRNVTAQAGLISIIGQADPQMSETRLKQLISSEPSGFLYFNLGSLYARQNLWAQAQQAYYQAYQLQPDHPDYAYNLAIGLEHLGQPKIALNYYRRALELSVQRGHASFDQGRVQERIGQLTARAGSS